MRRATPDELKIWDDLIAANPDGGNVLQTKVYGSFKQAYNWRPEHIIHELSDGLTIAVLYLARPVPGLGELWYAPKGPGVNDTTQLRAILADIRAAISQLAPGAFMVKLEPDLSAAAHAPSELAALGLCKAKYDLQWNRSTVVVDLAPSEDQILASFKQKTRYNIRLAERKGVEVAPVPLTDSNIDQMYELMHATQARAGFYMRSKEYLAHFWRLHAEAGHGQLFFATYQGQVLAGLFALHEGKQALYKDGGSTREHPELQAPYLLQWYVMRWHRDRGYTEYDLHGIPPAHRLTDPTHALSGLVQFKTGFNPDHITEYIGVYDLPLHKTKYHFWTRAGEKLVAGYSFRVRHELFY